MRKYIVALIFATSMFMLSCTPYKVTVLSNEEQYGIIYDARYHFPVTYKAKYIDLKGIDKYCEIQVHTIDNLYNVMPAKAYHCVDYFDGHSPTFYEPRGK